MVRKRRLSHRERAPHAWRRTLGMHIISFLGSVVVLVAIGYALTQGSIIRIQQIATTLSAAQRPSVVPSIVVAETASAPLVPNSAPLVRIQIATIALDAHIVPVGWEYNAQRQQNEWEVARYAVGHHTDSGVPGAGTNIVLSSHVAGYGRLFARLNDVAISDDIILDTTASSYTYRVTDIRYVPSTSPDQQEQIANLALLDPTPNEQLTLITCWPPSGPDRFTQRLVVIARPVP